MKSKIIDQCKKILFEHYVDANKFTYTIHKEEFTFYVYARIGKKAYFEISDIYADEDGNIIQYGINWMHVYP